MDASFNNHGSFKNIIHSILNCFLINKILKKEMTGNTMNFTFRQCNQDHVSMTTEKYRVSMFEYKIL